VKDKNTFITENELIAGLKNGDQEAFRILVERFRKKVISTCMGFVHSEADADDTAQEVFIEVFTSINNFRGDSSLSTWIYRIAVNKSLNFVRSAGRRKLLSLFDSLLSDDNLSANEPLSGRESCPDDGLKKSDQSRALQQAVDRLATNQRTAFILRSYDDLSYEEIAEVMKTTVSAVESLIFRAKQNMQKSLYGFYKKNMQ